VTSGWSDLSASYPLYLESIEDRLGVWGCLLLHQDGTSTYRFRCATHTGGPQPLEVEPFSVPFIDWRTAAYHVQQVSQGDFMADAGTPVSILASDDGVFHIDGVYANGAGGSISGGLRIMVRFLAGGASRRIQFSHLDDRVPRYVLDAAAAGTPLPAGTVFGFVGYTGNLWIGAPPATDGPYEGSGAGLPAAHSHVWFEASAANHEDLTPWARQALDYSGRYPYGGG
jgi:hypothetical protein